MTSDLPPTGGSQSPPEPPSAGPQGPASASAPTPPGPPSASTGHGTDDFFNRIRSVGVARPDEGRWIAGVAAGLSRRWDIDPILVRGGFVALTFAGGLGVVFYGLAWLLLPQDDGRIHLQQAIRGDFTAGFVGAVILSLAAIGGGGGPGAWHGSWFGWGLPGALLLTAAVVFGIWWVAKRDPENTPSAGRTTWTSDPAAPAAGSDPSGTGTTAYNLPPVYGSPTTVPAYAPTSSTPSDWTDASRRATEATQRATEAAWRGGEAARIRAEEKSRAARDRRARTGASKVIVRLTLGIALLTAAAILVIGNANDWSEPVGLIAATTALAVIAVGVITSGLSGRRASGLAGIGLLLTIGVLAGAGAEGAGVRSGQHLTIVGEQNWHPGTTDAAQTQFNLGVGEATLWLTDPRILTAASTTDPLNVQVRAGAGHLTVVLPESVSSRIDLRIGAGEASYPDGSTYRFNRGNGTDEQQRLTTGPAGAARIIVDVRQGAGQLDIRTTSGVSITTVPGTVSSSAAAPTPSASVTASAVPNATATK